MFFGWAAMKFKLLSTVREIPDQDRNRVFLTKTAIIKLNVKQKMERIQTKAFSMLILRKASAITKLSETVILMDSILWAFFKGRKALQKLKQPTVQKRRKGGK